MKLKKILSWITIFAMALSMTSGLETAWAASAESDFTVNASGAITGYSGSGGAVEIPPIINGIAVTSINEYAFNEERTITSVKIPIGVTEIGLMAFYECTALESVELPDSLTGIGSQAFWGTALINVVLPAELTNIGEYAFCECTSLISVSIPAKVTSIGTMAFSGCDKLTSIVVDSANPAFSSDADGILYNKDKTTLVQCPGAKTNVTIPDSVTEIGRLAFAECESLASVEIPTSVTSINTSAFYGCLSLSEITIPSGVTTIERDAFSLCPLTSVYLPASVTALDSFAFDGCTDLTSFQVDPDNGYYSSLDGIIYDKEKKALIMCPFGKTGSVVIPDGVTIIGGAAFDGCGKIDGVTIPSGVTSIEYQAFYGCSSLNHIVLPATVNDIGSSAFKDCSNMNFAFFMGNAPSTLGTNAFPIREGFRIYNLTGSTGFTSASWSGYSTYLTTLAPSDVATEDAESAMIGIKRGDTKDTLTQNITLELVGGIYGLPITWTSSNSSIISVSGNTGTVTRPAAAGLDTEVELTATVSCGGVSRSKDLFVKVLNLPPDTTAPTVTLVTPNSTRAAIGGNIAITFSKAMNTANGAVYLSSDGGSNYGSALTSGSWSAGNSVYTIAYHDLSYNTTYKIKIGGFQDTAGNGMSTDTSHSFTTAAKPLLTVGTGGGYATLTAALAAAADGDTITLLSNITESVRYTNSGKTIAIDGNNKTITSETGVSTDALLLFGSGTIKLKNLTLQGGAATEQSVGLTVTDSINVQSEGTVIANGGEVEPNLDPDKVNTSIGLQVTSSGTVNITEANGGTAASSIGVQINSTGSVNVSAATSQKGTTYSIGVFNVSGTINVNQATGSVSGSPGTGYGVLSYGDTVNVTTATGTDCGVFNMGVGTVNVTTATGKKGVHNGSSEGTVNVCTATGGTPTDDIDNEGRGTVNTGANTAVLTLNKGAGASCVLNSITVAASGETEVGILPGVNKNGNYSDGWYLDSKKTLPFNDTKVTGAATLYSIVYIADAKLSGGGGGTTTTPTTTVSGTTATTPVTPTVSGGVATGSVTADQMSDALKKAQAAAGASGTPNVTIQVSGASGASSVGMTIPHASLQSLVSGGVGALTISGPTGSVSFDADALKTIAGAGSSDVTVTVAKTDASTLPNAARTLVGGHPVFTFSVTSGGSTISQFGGSVTVSVPYTPTAAELADPAHIVVWYIDDSGNVVQVPNSHYDPATGTVVFSTTHFSYYAVANEPVIRLAGTGRIETALNIAQAAYPGKIANAVLATAGNYPDALAGSVLAYQLNAPILLVGSSEADQKKVLDYLKANLEANGTVYILGGAGVIGKSFEDELSTNGIKKISRLAGTDRYDTSVKIASQLEVKDGTPVVLVSGENYPDALSVSSIAAQGKLPILLVQKDRINDAVRQKITAIKPDKVYIIGLQGVISPAVENQITQITGLTADNIVRIGGADRYTTSLAVAQYFNLDSQTVNIATGSNYPDALAGSVYAAKHKATIILADGNLPEQVMNYLKSKNLTGAAIFGGEAVVGKDIEQQVKELVKQ